MAEQAKDLALDTLMILKQVSIATFDRDRNTANTESFTINCGSCAEACPLGAVSQLQTYEINPVNCDACGVCYHLCPVQAIELPSGI